MYEIGWIGTGVMGASMALNLSKDYNLCVYNRSINKAKALNLDVCTSIEDLVNKSNVICTMLGFPEDVEEVYFNHILKCDLKDKVLIDFTTTKPSLALKIYSSHKAFLDAPVSGGDIGAKNRTLSIMVGGDEDIFNKNKNLLEKLGKAIYQGSSSKGQHAKMSNQILICSTMLGMCEALLYAKKMDLDLDVLLSTISKGAAGCWSLDNLAPRILKHDYKPGFFVRHFVKDMKIALEEAKRVKLDLPGLEIALKLYKELESMDCGLDGTQALILEYEKRNHTSFFKKES